MSKTYNSYPLMSDELLKGKHMNTRKIDFIDDLRPNGELFAFTNKVKNENNLELCFRGNDNAANIYYNNQTVWKIYKTNNAGQYKVLVSVHKSLSELERERICKEDRDGEKERS